VGKRVLLLGAGFSRNWGGWLANEALEYLLGAPQTNSALRSTLLAHKAKGFEDALGALQGQASTMGRPPDQLIRMEAGLLEMFKAMNAAFADLKIDFAPVAAFLRRFDAIFTLNQDTLLERHYLKNVAVPTIDRHWQGGCLPGLERAGDFGGEFDCLWRPVEATRETTFSANEQPYIKLHGSSNWLNPESERQLLIMGGNKSAMISQFPILQWGFDKLKAYLEESASVMVIGYSFGDDHVNDILKSAADRNTIKLFVIDPLGMDVMDKYRGAIIPGPSDLKNSLWSVLRGCSRRSLTTTFSSDAVERAKLERFLVD